MKVLLVGFSPVTALGIESAISKSLEYLQFKGFGPAESLSKALDLTRLGNVALVVLDPHQPTFTDGLKFCRTVKETAIPPRILAFSGIRDERELAFASMAGIDSFVSVTESPERLAAAAVSALNGKREWVLAADCDVVPRVSAAADDLTAREQDVLWMVAERCTNEQIARSLSISPNTVKNHVASILRKLGVRSRSELFAGAVALGSLPRVTLRHYGAGVGHRRPLDRAARP